MPRGLATGTHQPKILMPSLEVSVMSSRSTFRDVLNVLRVLLVGKREPLDDDAVHQEPGDETEDEEHEGGGEEEENPLQPSALPPRGRHSTRALP